MHVVHTYGRTTYWSMHAASSLITPVPWIFCFFLGSRSVYLFVNKARRDEDHDRCLSACLFFFTPLLYSPSPLPFAFFPHSQTLGGMGDRLSASAGTPAVSGVESWLNFFSAFPSLRIEARTSYILPKVSVVVPPIWVG
ncbi:uncharacterized protein LY79DRAFT_568870, partial [Colletotrichum navitas]